MTESKIKSKLNKYDRRLLVTRIIPVLFLSCAVWTFSCYLFGFLVEFELMFTFIKPPMFYLIGIFSTILLFFLALYLSIKEYNTSAFILYLVLSFAAGIVPTALLYFMRFSGFLYIIFCVGIIPFTVILFMTGILGRFYYSKDARVFQVILSFIFTAVPVILFNVFFKLDDNLYYFIISPLLSFYVLVLITTYSARICKDYKAKTWMLFSIRVSIVFLLSLLLVGIIIGIIAIIVLAIFGDGDLSGLSFGSSRSSRNRPNFLYRLFFYAPGPYIIPYRIDSSGSRVPINQESVQPEDSTKEIPPKPPQSTEKTTDIKKIKICSKCGYENKDWTYCIYCGFKL